MSKEAIKLSRRDFLKASISLGASGLVAACKPETPVKRIEKVTIVTRVMERVVERLVTATPLPPEEIEPIIPPTVFKPTAPPSTAIVEAKPTVKPTPDIEPEATPTAVAYDVAREVEEKFKERNGEAEMAFFIRVGMLDIWPERMSEKIGDFVSFEVDPKITPLKLGEKTRVLVDPEDEMARVNLIPWYPEEPEEEREETLAFFTPLLPQKLNSWEIDYLINQKVGKEEELLHLAAYDNTFVVPFITPGTIGQEKWDKVMTLQASGRVANTITAIEGDEGEKEKPVIIFLDEEGEELLTADLKTIKLEEKETVRLEIEKGQYTFFDENNQEMPEKAVKLWEVPRVIPEKPEIQAPEIAGLKIVEEEGRKVYRAETGNPFGLEPGEFAGYFMPEVTYADVEDKENPEGEKIGGIGLRAEAVRELLKQKEGFVFSIPVDPQGTEGEVLLKRVEISGLPEYEGHGMLLIRGPEELNLVTPWLEEEQKSLLLSIGSGPGGEADFYFPQHVVGDAMFFHMMTPSVLANSKEAASRRGKQFGSGDMLTKLSNRNLSATLARFITGEEGSEWSLLIDVSGPKNGMDLQKEHLLQVDGHPVFILANDNPLLTS